MKKFNLSAFEAPAEPLLFLSGFNLILLNFILVQHFTAFMHHAEIAVILFSLSYFSGISAGVYFSDRISGQAARFLFPFLFVIQMLIFLLGQFAVFEISDFAGKWVAYGIIYLTVSAFSTTFYAVFLPAAVDFSGGLPRLYSIEILGSIAGLVFMPLLAAISHELVLMVYFSILMILGCLLKTRKRDLLVLMLLTVLFVTNFHGMDQSLSARVYRRRYPQKNIGRVIHTQFTPYHKIELVEEGHRGDLILFLNGKRQFSRGSYRTYSYYVAEFPSLFFDRPKALVLGCGSMATVGRLRGRAESIQIVDIDEKVFDVSKVFFKKYNHLDKFSSWSFTADDAKHYLGSTEDRFDLILHDIPPARSRQTALTYTAEFFQLVKKRLTPSGLFSMSSLTPLNSRSSYGKKVIKTLTSVFDNYFVLDAGGAVYFYGGSLGMKMRTRSQIEQMLPQARKGEVHVLLKEEIDGLVRNEEVITVNNVGDLIFA